MLLGCVLVCLMAGGAAGNVVLISKNVSIAFDDVEATFATAIKGSGERGVLHVAEPLDACTPLKNKIAEDPFPPFVLIIRGGCTFDDKVRSAQDTGFKAAIIYDSMNSAFPVAMAGNSTGIHIHAVFVSKASGETLKKYAGRTDIELWIIPTFENSAWSIMAISFISLLAMSAVLATCFFVRRHRIRRERPSTPNIREFHGMNSQLVKAMPSLIFTSVLEGNSTSRTCAICLEDYNIGERIRVLPCRHKFHVSCVDLWLTSWRTFCPVCKQDARASTSHPPASESTPLLSSAPSSPFSSTAALSSFHSSVGASFSPAIPVMSTPPRTPLSSRTHSLSSAIPIMSTPPRTPMSSRTHSLSGVAYMPNSYRSYNNSPPISISRGSFNHRNLSSHRSYHSHIASPHSIGIPLSSPLSSRYMAPCFPSSSNASASFLVASSDRQSYLRHCNSGTSLSAQDSNYSLPGC